MKLYYSWGEEIRDRNLNKCPQCNHLKIKKNVICSQCKARSKLKYVREGRAHAKLMWQEHRETYYCQNADCDRRGQELPKKEMVFRKHLWLCKRCENNK